MNTKLREEAKNDFEKDFFRLMSNSVFVKTMENVRNYGDVKLVATDKRRKRLVSEPNYHTSIQMICKMFIIIFMNTIYIKTVKY